MKNAASVFGRLIHVLSCLTFVTACDPGTFESKTYDDTSINFLGKLEGVIPISDISSSADDGLNIAANAIDNNIKTRWAAWGDGQYLALTFSEPHTVDSVEIAWHKGLWRTTTFDVELLINGQYVRVLSNQKSQGTNYPYLYQIGNLEGASGLRVIGHGTNLNTLNSISEIHVFGDFADSEQVPTPTPTPTPTPADCGSTVHGQTETRTRYQSATVPYGSVCISELQTRTCNDGIFTAYSPNNYQFDTCAVDPAPTPTPAPSPTPSPSPSPSPTPVPPHVPGNAIYVSTSAELMTALNNARGGETIALRNNGNYGYVVIRGIRPSSKVVVTSENPNNLSQLSRLRVENSENLEFNGLKIRGIGNTVYFLNNNRFLGLKNSDISGNLQFNRNNPLRSDLDTGFAVKIENSPDTIVEGNYVHDAYSSAVYLRWADRSLVKNNYCDWVAADCFKISDTNHVVFDGNRAGQNWHAGAGAHCDFLQALNNQNGTYINNLAIQNGSQFQGLFFGGTIAQNNNLIENNLIASGSGRGISIRGTGNVVRYNTVIRRMPKSYDYPVQIYGPDSYGNIISSKIAEAGPQPNGTSYKIQWENPNSQYHYSKFYQGAMNTGMLTIHDFKPVPGSPAETIGAYKLINYVINNP